MKINFYNTSNSELETVAKFAVPYKDTDLISPAIKIGDTNYKAVKYRDVGTTSKIYTIKGKFPVGEFEGEVVSDDSLYGDDQTFVMSDWVLKDLQGTVARVIVELQDGNEIVLGLGSLGHLVNEHLALFTITSPVVQGWKATQYITAMTGLDHLEFKMKVNWHDRNNPNMNTSIRGIRLECNDEVVITYAEKLGVTKSYNPMNDVWSLRLCGNATIADGQGLAVRGYILSNPEYFMSANADRVKDDIADRIENLKAVKNGNSALGGLGQVWGVAENMNEYSNWFNGYLPELSEQFNDDFLPKNYFWGIGMFVDRTIGAAKFPGQSGNQQDFGADGGLEATVLHKAQWIPYYQGALTDSFRRYNIHEPNGGYVSKELHPERVTWNQVTFNALTKDFLGKSPQSMPGPGTGWQGYDTQHVSQNGHLTYFALTGDELEESVILNAVHANIQQAKNLTLADREVGRTFACWAKQLQVLPTYMYARYKQFISKKIDEFIGYWRGGKIDQSRPIKVSEVILDPRAGIVNPLNGNLEPSWICYQHAQMIMGIYQLLTVYSGENRTALELILRDLCNTYVWHGVRKINDTWYPIMFQRYRTGLGSGVRVTNSVVGPDEGLPINYDSWEYTLDMSNGGWWKWVGPALSISKRYLVSQEDQTRIDEILDQAFPDGLTNLDSLKWWPLPLK